MTELVLARITELLGYRRTIKKFLRDNPSWRMGLGPLDREYRAELRALVTLARKARRLEAAAPDPIAQYKSFADWTEGEKAEAWGR